MFILTENTLAALPPARLLYRPFPSSDPEAPASVFTEGEALEFQQGQPAVAVDWYRRLAGSNNVAVRAGALLRLGRVLRKLGRQAESHAAYEQLSEIAGVQVAGAPAESGGSRSFDCRSFD